jgi:hypothetical protein
MARPQCDTTPLFFLQVCGSIILGRVRVNFIFFGSFHLASLELVNAEHELPIGTLP